MERLTLNLTHASTPLSIFNVAPQEFPESSSTYRAESQAAGGRSFSDSRRFRAVAYYRNVLPVEAGCASVGFSRLVNPTETYGDIIKLGYVFKGCETSCPEIIGYDPNAIKGIASTPKGSVILTQAGYAIFNGQYSSFKGINAGEATGIASIENHLIIYTPKTVYHSSSTDPFDFTPSIEGGGSSYSISAEIGNIVTVVPYARGAYILGTHGGVIGTCTGNVRYPMKYEPIRNFNGIYTSDNCVSFYNAESLYVYSRAGLQILSGAVATNIKPDWSDALREGRWAALTEFDEDAGEGFQTLQQANKVWTDAYETRDTPLTACYKAIYTEEISSVDCDVLVSNLSPRYVTVSYANRRRIAVIDLYLDRTTVVHAKHTSVFPKGEVFSYATGDGWVEVVKNLGLGTILYNELHQVRRNLNLVNNMRLYGMFRDTPASRVTFRTGTDRIHTNSIEHLSIALASTRELLYTGYFRSAISSFVVPFSGILNTITL